MNVQERKRNAIVEDWLRGGLAESPEDSAGESLGAGVVLVATDRAARAVLAAVQSGRRERGLEAWATPAIFSWDAWVREQWQERDASGTMLLNPLQEHALWTKVLRGSETGEALLHPDRLATTAQQAYRLVAGYAPEMLNAGARAGWLGEAGIFSDWLGQFEATCVQDRLMSASRLPVDLAHILQNSDASLREGSGDGCRAPLLLIGFDRLVASQIALLDAWGDWRLLEDVETGPVPGLADSAEVDECEPRFYRMLDSQSELAACVGWLREKLVREPEARLLVIVPALERRRGELERALLAEPHRASGAIDTAETLPRLDFEFSLGTPLGRVSSIRSAVLLLRWLAEPLLEAEVDWLLSSGHVAANAEEEIRLAEGMLELRRSGMERPVWSLVEFLNAGSRQHGRRGGRRKLSLSEEWVARMTVARGLLSNARTRQSPLEWAQVAAELLETAGWPGFRPESSASYQARQRWERVLDDCGSLGFDGSQLDWTEFIQAVAQAVSSAIFATESTGARIQITEPFESSGQLADGIWFLGAEEEDWPSRGTPHPLLPTGLQREKEMPHSSSIADWELAQAVTKRLMSAAPEVIFSYAEHAGEIEARPSRLLVQMVGEPESGGSEKQGGFEDSGKIGEFGIGEAGIGAVGQAECCETEYFEDWSRIAFPQDRGQLRLERGAATLTSQSICAFKAFATTRLAAGKWEPAEVGLNAKQRGQLLHDVLHAVWGGGYSAESGRVGVSSLAELAAIPDLRVFVHGFAQDAVERRADGDGDSREFAFAARFPRRYLELEVERLTRLVTEWLSYERNRLPFRVIEREASSDVVVAGLTLRVRLDRLDELPDGSLLIVDYKSGDIGPAAWKGERTGDRLDDVQLPLYATYALEGSEAPLEGLVFARVRPGDVEFCGRVRNAAGTLLPGLTGKNGLIKDPLTDAQLASWRALIEQLGQDFLEGRAEVDPKDQAKTCQRCHLHAVCRVYENLPLSLELSHAEDEDVAVASGSEAKDE